MPEDKKKIIWLASYPKSGNTWFRAFLSNLFADKDNPVDINNLAGGPIASCRSLFEDYSCLSSTDLNFDEVDNLRPAVYREFAAELNKKRFLKTHDAYTFLQSGEAMFPTDVTFCAVYLIRNPFDVAVSFAHHSVTTTDKMVETMGQDNFAFCSKNFKYHNQLRQKLLSWSNHVRSWTEQGNIPLIVLRYEDMKDDAVREFTRAIRFCEIDYSDDDIRKAAEQCDFDILKKQEEEKGFREKNPKSQSFFREGKKGNWRSKFNEEMINKIIYDHREVMIKYGYLNDENEILV